jgi:diadenosine tetraphosphate (Ap4A) HIT family hydrolase
MENCVFCDPANFSDRILAEDKQNFLVVSRGQITDGGYLLLIPKRHAPSFSDISFEDLRQLSVLAQQMVEILKTEYGVKDILIFEHGIVGQTVKHAHLHLLPASCDLTGHVAKDFPNNPIEPVNSAYLWSFLSGKRGTPYLLWWVSQVKEWRICFMLDQTPSLPLKEFRNPPPPQYLRLVTAEILGRPERGDWRAMDQNLDETLRLETMARLKNCFQPKSS